MAFKAQGRNVAKDKNFKQNNKPAQNELPDEIALRDEIFQLKRQIMLLKKSNERNVIKVRKFEDEARKKDKQIEQLMDPVKNGDVRKLLSTKGAALLLNLKEQNNTLIQMILAKDLQIRKLLSEIKTSKLYANSRRTECYRNEIDRLRNLLIKSQNMMKEAQGTPQTRSICVGGTPTVEMTLSSNQSSPRDLEELQTTIQSLEMHMKYANDLLAKKNEQILHLTSRLDSLQCSVCRRRIETKSILDVMDKYNTGESFTSYERNCKIDGESDEFKSYNLNSNKFLFNTNVRDQQVELTDQKRLTNSAPAGLFTNVRDSTYIPSQDSVPIKQNEEMGKLTCNGHCKDDSKTEKNFLDPKIDEITDNVNHCLPEKSYSTNFDKTGRKSSSSSAEDNSDIDTAEFEMMEKKIEHDQIEVETPVKLKSGTPMGIMHETNNSTLDTLAEANEPPLLIAAGNKLSSSEHSTSKESKRSEDNEKVHCQHDYCDRSTAENERNDTDVSWSLCTTDEDEGENSNLPRTLCQPTPDSSLESESYVINSVQIEAEINCFIVGECDESDRIEQEPAGAINHQNDDVDDDDDVVVR